MHTIIMSTSVGWQRVEMQLYKCCYGILFIKYKLYNFSINVIRITEHILNDISPKMKCTRNNIKYLVA